MTGDRDFKRRVRTRMTATGEAYSTARRKLLDENGKVPPPPAIRRPLPDIFVRPSSGMGGESTPPDRRDRARLPLLPPAAAAPLVRNIVSAVPTEYERARSLWEPCAAAVNHLVRERVRCWRQGQEQPAGWMETLAELSDKLQAAEDAVTTAREAEGRERLRNPWEDCSAALAVIMRTSVRFWRQGTELTSAEWMEAVAKVSDLLQIAEGLRQGQGLKRSRSPGSP